MLRKLEIGIGNFIMFIYIIVMYFFYSFLNYEFVFYNINPIDHHNSPSHYFIIFLHFKCFLLYHKSLFFIFYFQCSTLKIILKLKNVLLFKIIKIELKIKKIK